MYRGQSARKARWGRLAVKGRRVNAVRQESRESKVYLVLPGRLAVRDPRANVEQPAQQVPAVNREWLDLRELPA